MTVHVKVVSTFCRKGIQFSELDNCPVNPDEPTFDCLMPVFLHQDEIKFGQAKCQDPKEVGIQILIPNIVFIITNCGKLIRNCSRIASNCVKLPWNCTRTEWLQLLFQVLVQSYLKFRSIALFFGSNCLRLHQIALNCIKLPKIASKLLVIPFNCFCFIFLQNYFTLHQLP